MKSTQFVGNKDRASDFLKKQRNKGSKFLLDTLQPKKKKKNEQHSPLFLKAAIPNVQKKILENETTGEISSRLKTCTTLFVGIFKRVF